MCTCNNLPHPAHQNQRGCYEAAMHRVAHPDARPTVEAAVYAAMQVSAAQHRELINQLTYVVREWRRVATENARLNLQLERAREVYQVQREVYDAPLGGSWDRDGGLDAIERLNTLLKAMEASEEEKNAE